MHLVDARTRSTNISWAPAVPGCESQQTPDLLKFAFFRGSSKQNVETRKMREQRRAPVVSGQQDIQAEAHRETEGRPCTRVGQPSSEGARCAPKVYTTPTSPGTLLRDPPRQPPPLAENSRRRLRSAGVDFLWGWWLDSYCLCMAGFRSEWAGQECEHPSFTHPCAFYVIFVACVCAQLLRHVWLLCNPRDCSLPGSSIHGILQARILEWVATASSNGIFATQGSSLCLLHLLHWQAGSLPLRHPGRPMLVRGGVNFHGAPGVKFSFWLHLILSRHNSSWFFRWGNWTQRSHATSPRSLGQSVVEQESKTMPSWKLSSSRSEPPKTKFEFMKWGGWVRPERWGKAAQVSLLTTSPSSSFTRRYSIFKF